MAAMASWELKLDSRVLAAHLVALSLNFVSAFVVCILASPAPQSCTGNRLFECVCVSVYIYIFDYLEIKSIYIIYD